MLDHILVVNPRNVCNSLRFDMFLEAIYACRCHLTEVLAHRRFVLLRALMNKLGNYYLSNYYVLIYSTDVVSAELKSAVLNRDA